MIDRGNVLPLTRQTSLLRLSRSSVYYLPRPVPPARLAIMRRIDEVQLEHPFAGTASDVWADTAYRSAKNEAMLTARGLVSRIHRK